MGRSYHQACLLARALDILGERWTLLVVRDLLLGPKRYKDLLDGLPGMGTNLLAKRLKDLEAHGLVERRTLPPPAAASVYDLTPLGRGLEGTILELSRWAMQLDVAADDRDLRKIAWMSLALKMFFKPDKAAALDRPLAIECRVAPETVHFVVADGALTVAEGPVQRPDAVLTGDPGTYRQVMSGRRPLADAQAAGDLELDGDPALFGCFLDLFRD